MTPIELLEDYSLEMTAKEIGQIREKIEVVPVDTQILIPFLPGEDFDTRVTAAKMVKELGYVPMPNLAARRFRSRNELEGYLDRLASEGVDRVLVVAGDPPHPEGPFEDALSIIESGFLQKYGFKHVGISGYPNGHPNIDGPTLHRSMLKKHSTLVKMGLESSIVTQFDFNAETILTWLWKIRRDGINFPVRVGVAGPMDAERLVAFTKRCGVRPTNVYPEPKDIVEGLAGNYDPEIHGKMLLHFYPFGEVAKTGVWIRDYKLLKQL